MKIFNEEIEVGNFTRIIFVDRREGEQSIRYKVAAYFAGKWKVFAHAFVEGMAFHAVRVQHDSLFDSAWQSLVSQATGVEHMLPTNEFWVYPDEG